MPKPLHLVATAIAIAALALTCLEIAKLMDIGTCASGGPYVSARPCPEGTGARILLLMAAILVYTVAVLASGQGLFFFGLLFLALGAVFIRGGVTDDGFAATGYSVGGLFCVMGIVPLALAVHGWFERDDETGRQRAARIAAYTDLTSGSGPWRGRS